MTPTQVRASTILAQIELLDGAVQRPAGLRPSSRGRRSRPDQKPAAGGGQGSDLVDTLVRLANDFKEVVVGAPYPLDVTRAFLEVQRDFPDPSVRPALELLHKSFHRAYLHPRVFASVAHGAVTIDGVSFSGIEPTVCRIIEILWRHAPDPVSQRQIRVLVPGTEGDKTIRRFWVDVPWQVKRYIHHVPGRAGGLALRLPDESVRSIISRDDPPED